MQTFLPYKSFTLTAKCLDRQRLGNQRCEAKVILKTLLGESDGWINHPAVRMWRGFELVLCSYGMSICREWRRRGYKDRQLEYFNGLITTHQLGDYPPWLGDEEFHASHRSNLLRKNPEHYAQFNWSEPDDLPYVWPVPKEE